MLNNGWSRASAVQSHHSSGAERTLDAYGFDIPASAEVAAARRACEASEQICAAKWEKWMVQRVLPPQDKLKKYCRRGIPPQVRPWAWMAISGAAERRTAHMAGYFAAMVDQGLAASPCAHQIELDLGRTFPGNAWMGSGEGEGALRQVLVAFSVHAPRVGYCQSMNYLAAMALLATGRDPEAAFWMLAALIDDGGILYRDTFVDNLVGAHVEMRSLQEVVAAKVPRVAAHMARLSCDMTLVATDWFMCLFSTTLPCETAMRVWDALLSEGGKILYRVAVALLRTHEDALLAQDSAGDFLQAVRAAAAATHDRDRLMTTAFAGIGSMPMARIRSVRTTKQACVEDELRWRAERRAASGTAVPTRAASPAAMPPAASTPGMPLALVALTPQLSFSTPKGLRDLRDRIKLGLARGAHSRP